MKIKQPTLKIGLLALTILSFSLFSFDVPKGWFIAGSHPSSYEIGTAPNEGRDGKNCATIQSKEPKIKGFATLMQNCDPEKYFGKRIKMSGYLKVQDVESYAGLWLRIDGVNKKKKYKMLGFDNMHKRKIKGSIDWIKYEIVLDVPNEANNIAYGALLAGTGKIWFDDITFEIVNKTIPTTN